MRQNEEKYTINEVACDWLNLSTFDKRQGDAMMEYMQFLGMGDKKFMQYEGYGEGGQFAGEGIQKGFKHWLFQSTGRDARFWLDYLKDNDNDPFDLALWRSSRFDIQLTLAMPHGYQLRGWEWVWRNEGKRKVNHFESGQGDTVYCGSRKARKLVRIYVKGWVRDDSDMEGVQHIRVEFQLRQELATAVLRQYQDGERLESIFNGLWDGINGRIPRVAGYDAAMCPIVRDVFDNALPNLATQLEYNKLVSPDTLKWIKSDVDSAIMKVINSHDDYGALVLNELVGKWSQLLQRRFGNVDI